MTETRNNKETLNPRAGRNYPFKANHQRRHRVKTGEHNGQSGIRGGGGEGQSVDVNHPLVQHDPILKVQNEVQKVGECDHWIAKGWCKLKDNGKCQWKHPGRFDAKNFLCGDIQFKQTGICKRGAKCSFSHNRKEFPCNHYHQGKCTRDPCSFSHEWTPKRYQKWEETKQIKYEANKAWKERMAERNRQNMQRINQSGNTYAAGGNAMTQNDERLNAVSSNTNFNSALTE